MQHTSRGVLQTRVTSPFAHLFFLSSSLNFSSTMSSDDDVDHDLLDLLRKSLGLGPADPNAIPETKVLQDAEYIYNNSVDVALDMRHTKVAALQILKEMKARDYSTKSWAEHELHPKGKEEGTVDFIFTMDLLNFSFWSERGEGERFGVSYGGTVWTGYWSLVAALQRALEEGIAVTSPEFWINEEECTEEVLRHVFRSATEEEIPLFEDRVRCLREAGRILDEVCSLSLLNSPSPLLSFPPFSFYSSLPPSRGSAYSSTTGPNHITAIGIRWQHYNAHPRRKQIRSPPNQSARGKISMF